MRYSIFSRYTRFSPARLVLAAVPALMLAGCTEQGQATDTGPEAAATPVSDAKTPQTDAFIPQTPPANLPPDILAEMLPPLTDAMLRVRTH